MRTTDGHRRVLRSDVSHGHVMCVKRPPLVLEIFRPGSVPFCAGDSTIFAIAIGPASGLAHPSRWRGMSLDVRPARLPGTRFPAFSCVQNDAATDAA